MKGDRRSVVIWWGEGMRKYGKRKINREGERERERERERWREREQYRNKRLDTVRE